MFTSYHQLQHMFYGLSLEDIAQILMVHMCAHTLRLLQMLPEGSSEKKLLCANFLSLLNPLQKHLSNNSLTADSFTNALLAQIHHLKSCDPAVFQSVLQANLSNHRPAVMHLNSQVINQQFYTHCQKDLMWKHAMESSKIR